jgi:hypothetical protein
MSETQHPAARSSADQIDLKKSSQASGRERDGYMAGLAGQGGFDIFDERVYACMKWKSIGYDE